MIHHIRGQSVNDVYEDLAKHFAEEIVQTACIKSNTINRKSRVGDVHELKGLTILEYYKPEQRVLFCPIRDANPYFHLMEAMWMLAGRKDVGFLATYSKQASGLILGAASYGYRWRKYFGVDQLEQLVTKLKIDPTGRRAYLAMWDPESDLTSKEIDVPCNLGIKFEIREGRLEMTVFNRSNDAIWGACGANVVHMSFLQEYVANMVGVPMGSYFQVSGNMHVYSEVYEERMKKYIPNHSLRHFYRDPDWNSIKLVTDPMSFDHELEIVLKNHKTPRQFENDFLGGVVRPAMVSWDAYKAKFYTEAEHAAENIVCEDWRFAMKSWLLRREEIRLRKEDK